MATFTYKARTRQGEVLQDQVEGTDTMAVAASLRQQGLLVIDVKEQGVAQKDILAPFKRVKLGDTVVFTRQFATMINAGLPIVRALYVLSEQTENPKLKDVIDLVRKDVEAGLELSEALDKHPSVFDRLYVEMVRAGEIGGILDGVLLRIADQLEKDQELRRKVKSAMTYPIVVLGFVSLILAGMLIFIVPQFEGIYESLGGTLPLPTRMLLTVSEVFRKFWYIVLLLIVAIWLGMRQYRKTEQGARRFDKIKISAPIFGPLFHKAALSRFARTLGSLMRSGVPILQALDIVGETVNNRIIADAVSDVKQGVREGEVIARPLAGHDVFPPMVVQMLAVGEETGAVDTMLDKVADFYDDEVTAAVDSLTSIIEPVMIAVIGGMVGLAVIALYMPMFNIINLIQ